MIGGADILLGVGQFLLEENPIMQAIALALKITKTVKQIADFHGQIYKFFTANGFASTKRS